MPNAKSDSSVAARCYLTLDQHGKCIRMIRDPDGTKRLPTKSESEEVDRAFRESLQEMGRQFQEFFDTVAHDPDYTPPLSRRYLEYVQWKRGLAPHYRPTWADLAILAAENVRETYRPRVNPHLHQGHQPSQQHWLTVRECADLLMTDVSGLDRKKAMARVSWAASKNKFRTNGKTGNARRIDRDSFSTWRLEQRERGLDADNEGH